MNLSVTDDVQIVLGGPEILQVPEGFEERFRVYMRGIPDMLRSSESSTGFLERGP